MISNSVAFLVESGRRVFFDAEHFFDGYRANAHYAIQAVQAAEVAGAECVVLCDTNGGMMPDEISTIVHQVRQRTGVELGIHTHNDADMAVAGALAAVRAGVTQVQGTMNGYGERCGNANLVSLIANLKLKLGIECVSDEQLASLTEASRYVAEVANMPTLNSQPYVGGSAFAHKGGLHASAVSKVEHSYQHIQPRSSATISGCLSPTCPDAATSSGRAREVCPDAELTQAQARQLLEEIKTARTRLSPDYSPPFSLVDFVSMVEKRSDNARAGDISSQVMLKVRVDDEVMHTAAEGNGPVNALDHALRKALEQFYPDLQVVRLL
ncbi:(R)-citramalate synthase [Geodia barretti]|uniref:2-isopropylmalate synthase n=1 Tax=Geodia barretti TaxID=519541 RepID=A0AA35RY02_GEOBA|nr:(R)-citramalate synthase [Geodia barretti]